MTTDVTARKAWARPLIQADADAPAYGSPEWLALPDGPSKVAAVVRAAECWATDGDNLEANLLAQVDALAAYDTKLTDDADWRAGREAHRRAFLPRLPGFRRDPRIQADIEAEHARWTNGDDAA